MKLKSEDELGPEYLGDSDFTLVLVLEEGVVCNKSNTANSLIEYPAVPFFFFLVESSFLSLGHHNGNGTTTTGT